MKEELKREIEENGIRDTAFYDVYKTSNGLYIIKELCDHFNIGDREDYKTIKDNLCYKITEEDLEIIDKESAEQAVHLIPNIVTIFDLQLVLSFTVYKDTNHDNKLYVTENTCQRYNIEPKSKRTINGATCCNVTEEDLVRIEEETKKDKVAFKRKIVEVALNDEIKPAEYLFEYYYDYQTKKYYVRRNVYEMLKSHGIEIEGTPTLLNGYNCYSITENELKEVEKKLNYHGVEQLLKPTTLKKEDFPKVEFPQEDVVNKVVEQIYEFKQRKNLFEKVMPYKEKEFNEIAKPFNKEEFKDIVMPYIDRIIPFRDRVIPFRDRVIPFRDRVMPYYEKHTTTKQGTVLIYKDTSTGKLYIPVEEIGQRDQTVDIIMNKACYEIVEDDLLRFIDKKIIIADTYVVTKKDYDILICNNNGQLFIAHEILNELGFYIDNPHRIKVNGEIYEEIAEEDVDLIKGLENESCHINIIVKQIAPKRG